MNAKTLYPDLFPETLLVNREGEHIFTTSLKIAEYFGKNHKNVLRSIYAINSQTDESNFGLISEFGRLNFEPTSYTDKWNREQQIFKISHDGFAILAMSFSGKKALEWKIKFLNAFREMEAQLLAQKDREATALYHIRPRWKPIVKNPDMKRSELISLTGHKAEGSITACRRRMRDAGLIN